MTFVLVGTAAESKYRLGNVNDWKEIKTRLCKEVYQCIILTESAIICPLVDYSKDVCTERLSQPDEESLWVNNYQRNIKII